MIITPLEALVPYIAVADASFKIVKLSTSLGLSVANTLESIGRPSKTTSGSLFANNEDPPLILIVGTEPGEPPLVLIVTPATLPVNKLSTVTFAPLLKSFELIVLTEPVASFFLTVP